MRETVQLDVQAAEVRVGDLLPYAERFYRIYETSFQPGSVWLKGRASKLEPGQHSSGPETVELERDPGALVTVRRDAR